MKHLIFKIKHCLSLMLIYFFHCFPIKENKIFFFSYYGSQYGCNPKYITEYILNHASNSMFDLVWAFNDPASKKHIHGVKKVKTMSLRYFYELCTSKIIITNFRTTDLFKKRKNQYYIQTWHSSLRLKKIEKDAKES
ncbi:MAG: CDP-glycerol glycerophosphotransferase family protein, partial [Heyndrickxia sp.]